jgi:para-aminobenzoate synthetase component I
MNIIALENFVFLPFPGHHGQGKLHVLGSRGGYRPNVFVLIPYGNPKKQEMAVQYYPILSSHEVNLTEEVSSTALKSIRPQPSLSKEEYLHKVLELKKHIQYGNIYEINFCMNFTANNAELDPLHTFIELQKKANAPYAALVKLGKDYILCASPELFLKKENTRLITKPIKGTARRGKTEQEDKSLKQELQNSLKEQTENVMAVDVARNDLSIIAERASVKVDTLFGIESFATVHQMVSTVSCQIKSGTSFEAIIKATFPMASMTGAPKQMAMDLVDEFEDFDRHYYSGSFGILDEKGDFELNVVIRSIFYNSENKQINFAVGGAITYLSEPEQEYEECLLKAENLIRALTE